MASTILICGSRTWARPGVIAEAIKTCKDKYGDVVIIHGACYAGADYHTAKAALKLELVTVAVPAKLTEHGKAAGLIRNSYMLEHFNPVLVLAFATDFDKSKGTMDTVTKARAKGIPTVLINGKGFFHDFTRQLPDNPGMPNLQEDAGTVPETGAVSDGVQDMPSEDPVDDPSSGSGSTGATGE